jgi:hypothetical protein
MPIEERLKLSKASTATDVDAMRYRNIVGRLRLPDVDRWKSTSGVSCLVAWQSLKHKVVALFTCEAKYIAASGRSRNASKGGLKIV